MSPEGEVAKLSVFDGIPQENYTDISQLGSIQEYQIHETIFNQGEPLPFLYAVLDGEVELSITFQDEVLKMDVIHEESIVQHREISEKQIIVDTIRPGELMAWSALVKPGLATATAICSEATRVFALPSTGFKTLMDQNPPLGYIIMSRMAEIIARRLQNRTSKLIEVWGEYFDLDKL